MADMAKIHTIDGVHYREVVRKVRDGDQYIVPLESRWDLTRGKAYKVTGIDSCGDPEFVDDAGDPRACLSEGEYVVLEPVAVDLSAIESELAAMKAKVAEMERQLAEVKKGTPEDRLKVGDYAKVVSTKYFTMDGFKVGEIVQVIESPYGDDDCDYKIQRIDGRRTGYAHKERGLIVRATDEEVAEAKRKLIQPGVYVKLQIPDGSWPRYGWGGARNGDIGKVASRDGDKVRVDFPAQSGWKALIHELVLATEEERKKEEEADRKREESEKWAAIGRKPGEFKVGDVVKIAKYQFGHAKGSIVEVTEAYGSFVKVSGIHRGTLCTFDADIDCVELIAPVESVVNLRGGDVA
ncbi:hypothetical protein [Brevibacillus sp. NL20B1]|uniref:hypothetical protein n=1 Tax=Brevibacillus sp. NL20B1 TaxID=2829799 RepID=UPI001B9C32B7|nr:hypothetical protein [Brevibacillus sp. NL20B1]MBR8661163.1 hypothetical protein [Brevibacillus sp. NL20B1]